MSDPTAAEPAPQEARSLRALLPVAADAVDPLPVYDVERTPRGGRPHVLLNMVASADGATAAPDGVTAGISSPSDKRIFSLLRSLADVVLVGAQTVRAEGYRTVRVNASAQGRRAARGQADVAALAIVTASLELDWSAPLFAEPTRRPFVLAPDDADPARLEKAASVATVIRAGTGRVDLAAALGTLSADHGVRIVLCEGGPTVNAQLAAAGLVDELCLTVSPLLLGGPTPTILGSPALAAPLPLRLASALSSDGHLFLRYEVTTSGEA